MPERKHFFSARCSLINHTLCLRGNHWDPSWLCPSFQLLFYFPSNFSKILRESSEHFPFLHLQIHLTQRRWRSLESPHLQVLSTQIGLFFLKMPSYYRATIDGMLQKWGNVIWAHLQSRRNLGVWEKKEESETLRYNHKKISTSAEATRFAMQWHSIW